LSLLRIQSLSPGGPAHSDMAIFLGLMLKLLFLVL